MAERSEDPPTVYALARRIRIRAAALESGRDGEDLAIALMTDLSDFQASPRSYSAT